MIKIGDFSKLSQLPVKTLRYYDEIGLLQPAAVDPVSSYRFYSAAQLPRLRRIQALKELGLSLHQISLLLDGDLPAEQIVGMLRRRQVELQQQISDGEAMLGRLEARLRQFERENRMPEHEVLLKTVPPMWIVSVRAVVPTYAAQAMIWDQLMPAMKRAGLQGIDACFTIDHDETYKEENHDLEVCYQIMGQAAVEPPAQVRQLPGAESMASLLHHGSFNTLHESYQQIIGWLDENGWRITGPGREIYLSTGRTVHQDDPSYITEIQFPVEPAD